MFFLCFCLCYFKIFIVSFLVLCKITQFSKLKQVWFFVLRAFAERRGLFHIPHMLPLASCAKSLSSQNSNKFGFSSFVLLRRDGDSNPGYAFDVYTLSRRASSATRASLQLFGSIFLFGIVLALFGRSDSQFVLPSYCKSVLIALLQVVCRHSRYVCLCAASVPDKVRRSLIQCY